MTEQQIKALGLPTDEQIKKESRIRCEGIGQILSFEEASVWVRETAASRIKEVAADHNEWILKREGLIRGEYTDGQLTWWDDQTQRSYTKTSLFDLFIKERSGEWPK